MSRGAKILAGMAVAVALFVALPAFSGYHVGYNGATDNVCLSRLVQWCKHRDVPPAPVVTTPATIPYEAHPAPSIGAQFRHAVSAAKASILRAEHANDCQVRPVAGCVAGNYP